MYQYAFFHAEFRGNAVQAKEVVFQHKRIRIQAIQNKKETRFYVFRSWGRIGSDTIGGTKVETFHERHNAIDAFHQQFHEKTENNFLDSNYVKMPGRFFPLDVDYRIGSVFPP